MVEPAVRAVPELLRPAVAFRRDEFGALAACAEAAVAEIEAAVAKHFAAVPAFVHPRLFPLRKTVEHMYYRCAQLNGVYRHLQKWRV